MGSDVLPVEETFGWQQLGMSPGPLAISRMVRRQCSS